MSREWLALTAVAALGLEGVVAASLGFAPFESSQAWLATLTLWIAGACGLLAWLCVPASRTGLLIVLAAVAWGVAAAVPDLNPSGELLRRIVASGWAAILAHAVLTFPSGRATSSSAVGRSAIAGYAALALPPPLSVAALIVALAAGMVAPKSGIARTTRLWSVAAAVTLAAGIAIAAGLPGALTEDAIDSRLASEIGLAGAAILLSTGLLHDAERSRRVENVLLEFGPGGGDALTMRLASILEDPRLRIGYWIEDQARYLDPAGRGMAAAEASGRMTTEIERDGRRIALLEHPSGQEMDAAVLDAIGRAADLGSTNARLQSEVERQRIDVDASRRRLAQAANEERRQLTRRIEEVLEPRLAELERALVAAEPSNPRGRGPLTQVRRVRAEVAALARGLAPKAMDRGLATAMTELAEAVPIPVTVDVALGEDIDVSDDSDLYFVCSEALANVTKHARATAVAIHLTQVDGRLELEVRDNGIGGADARSGTGLRGLRDRVEAGGGTFLIESPAGRGTVVRAMVPLHARPSGVSSAAERTAISE